MRQIPFYLLFLLFLLACAPQTTGRSVPLNDWRFGVIESAESPDVATALGASWTRVRFQWAEMQPHSAEEWLLPLTEEQLATELASGREVVGMLIGIPDWARDEKRLPQGLWLPAQDKGNLWAEFVRRMVGQYAGTINHWIIWNEPDIWDVNTPAHSWEGDEKEFAQLMRVAYLVAKETNPQSVIHLAAMTYYWDAQFGREQYLSRLLDVLMADEQAKAHNYYFDIATAHIYFQPNAINDILQTFQAIFAEHGLEKPFWLVETNAPPIDDPAWKVENVTLAVWQLEQAAYIPQALAVALASGVERIAIYKLKDTVGDYAANPEPFGLVRQDGSQRPAFATAQTAFRLLAGVIEAERERWNEVGQVRLSQKDRQTTVIFARLPAPQQAQIPAVAGKAWLFDQNGNRQIVRAQNGLFQVDLPAAICAQSIGDYCMIGGAVFYLVQGLDGALPKEEMPAFLPPPTPFVPKPASEITAEAVKLAANPIQSSVVLIQQPSDSNLPILKNEASLDFPNSLTFRLELDSSIQVASAILHYDLNRKSCVPATTQVPMEQPANTMEWRWEFVRSGNPPPGAVASWWWEVTDSAGTTLTTPNQQLAINDTRFNWRTVSSERIDLHWYSGDSVGSELLEAADAGLIRLEKEMGIELPAEVDIFIYGNSDDMRQAMLYVQEWAGGLAFSDYGVILMGVRPAEVEDWGKPTIAHELAHLVVGQFGWSCVGGSRPTWLEEGLAMYAEGEPQDYVLNDIANGITNNSFVPVRSLTGAFPAHGVDAGIAYSQSYSLVAYLLENYGRQKLSQLILLLTDGHGYDPALEQVYGFNMDGLETEWRAAIGAPAREIPPTPTPLNPNLIPTVAPMQLIQTLPTPPAAASPPPVRPDQPKGGCTVGLIPIFLLFSFSFTKRRKQ